MADATPQNVASATNNRGAVPTSIHPQTQNYVNQDMNSLQAVYNDMMNQMDRFSDEMNRLFAYQGRMMHSPTPNFNRHRHFRSMQPPFMSSLLDRDPFRDPVYDFPSTLMPHHYHSGFGGPLSLMDCPSLAGGSASALAIPPTSNFINAFRPRVDIRDEGSQLIVHADLPGIEKEDVKVDVVNGMLNITAEHKEDKSRDEANFHMQERCIGKFHRTFRLPESVKEDEIRAAFNQGVLEVKLPKDVPPEEGKKSIRID